MINKIFGTISEIKEKEIFIKNDFFEFIINFPKTNRLKIGNKEEIKISFIWNSENGPSLFGFLEENEKMIFESLISCSGIGPKIAITIIDTLDIAIIYDSIINNKPKILTQVSGIGLKKAEMIIIQLKNSFEKMNLKIFEASNLSKINTNDLIQGLEYLGYNQIQINNAIKKVIETENIENLQFHEIMRIAINNI